MNNVAIIGAGVAGLAVARQLLENEHIRELDVFEKSRGVGGRMATRRSDEFRFDHGATFFTARDDEFKKSLKPLLDSGIVACWEPRCVTLNPHKKISKRQWFEPHYIGVGGNNSVGKYLAGGQSILRNTQIVSCFKMNGLWFMHDASGNQYGPYTWLISSIPAPQVMTLNFSDVRDFVLPPCVSETKMTSCFSMMLGYSAPLPVSWHWARVNDSCISSISLEYSKPGGADSFGVVVKANELWSKEYENADMQWVQKSLKDEFHRLLFGNNLKSGVDELHTNSRDSLNEYAGLPALTYISCHRWLYSQVNFASEVPDAHENSSTSTSFYSDEKHHFSACGDWFLKGNLESAFLSGNRLGEHLNRILG